MSTANERHASTPSPRRVRVSGRLVHLAVSQGILTIELGPGSIVAARWEGREAIEWLISLMHSNVVCEGMGIFRPSGILLRIDADAIDWATVDDERFAQLPFAVAAPKRVRPVLPRASAERSPYAAFIGSVPAEESDEEFAAAVEAIS